jgi:hypothetical protein
MIRSADGEREIHAFERTRANTRRTGLRSCGWWEKFAPIGIFPQRNDRDYRPKALCARDFEGTRVAPGTVTTGRLP